MQLEPDINNYLILFAENLGLRPPNTAAILVNDGKTDRFFRLSSDMKVCSSLNFTYNKNKGDLRPFGSFVLFCACFTKPHLLS